MTARRVAAGVAFAVTFVGLSAIPSEGHPPGTGYPERYLTVGAGLVAVALALLALFALASLLSYAIGAGWPWEDR